MHQSATATEHVRVAIIGTGFSGLGMAINLKQAGIEDFAVLERADDVGGTWRDNTYPGCRCDVPSHLYSFSFVPKPDWSESYSPQPEIWDYLRDCALRFGVMGHVRLETELTDARWDDGAQRWRLETSRGPLTAQILVAGPGPLSEPAVPHLPGIESFTGKVFHSARWDHGHDLTGERVAVIGTGASAIQFVPRIRREAAQVHVFQRTPPWIVPHPGRRTTRAERALYRRFPVLQRAVREGIYWGRETLVLGFAVNPLIMRAPEAIARWNLKRIVKDPALRAKLTPDYRIGCKRILVSNDYLPALTAPDVSLETAGVRQVRERSIVTADGRELEVDTIIYATGFHVTDMPLAHGLRGRDGRTLAEHWAGSPRAHLGATVTGFPNLFFLIGPNTGLGHSSMVFMIESQLRYVMEALRAMEDAGAATVEVRPEAQRAFNAELDEALKGTVWTSGGCASWYLDSQGRASAVWPTFTYRFRRRLRRFDESEYLLQRPRVPEPVPAAA